MSIFRNLELKEGQKMGTTRNSLVDIFQDKPTICKELQEYRLNDLLGQKRRQQLRANSHELRQLERQLQSALVFKQLREQQENTVQRKENTLSKQREENIKFAVEYEKIHQSIMQDEKQEKQKKELLFDALKCQMRDLQLKRRIEFEELKNSCDEMDNLMKQIHTEKIERREKTELLQTRFRIEMEESRRNIKLKQQLEKVKSIDETERNLEYQRQREVLKSQIIAEKKLVQREKEAHSERIGQQLELLNREKEIRENLLLSLLVEERKAKDDRRYREDLIKQDEERQKARSDMKNLQQEIKIRKEKQFKIEEEKFLQENLSYLEERDKIIQLSDQKRRQKKMEHSKALTELVDIRRRQKANEIAARIADFEKMLIDENKSNQLIKEERMRILNTVPKELLCYLPPGVLNPCDEFLILPAQKIELTF